MFSVEGSDVVVAALDVHYKFLSWSVKIRPFDPILEAFGSYPVGSVVVLRIDNVLAGEHRVVPTDYQYIEDGEYTAFGQQFDNDRSKVDFSDRVEADP